MKNLRFVGRVSGPPTLGAVVKGERAGDPFYNVRTVEMRYYGGMITGRLIWGTFIALLMGLGAAEASEAVALTLSGSWVGTWVDTRAGYNHSGGNFTGEVTEKAPGEWAGRFSLGKSKTFDVLLKGKRVGDKLQLDTTVDLGKYYGNYTIKGTFDGETFSAEYEGAGEKGRFTMRKGAGAGANLSSMPERK